MSDRLPGAKSEYISDKMANRLPKRWSENVFNKMPDRQDATYNVI
jgi:hypothetical protein